MMMINKENKATRIYLILEPSKSPSVSHRTIWNLIVISKGKKGSGEISQLNFWSFRIKQS